jgi:hypothetical protein
MESRQILSTMWLHCSWMGVSHRPCFVFPSSQRPRSNSQSHELDVFGIWWSNVDCHAMVRHRRSEMVQRTQGTIICHLAYHRSTWNIGCWDEPSRPTPSRWPRDRLPRVGHSMKKIPKHSDKSEHRRIKLPRRVPFIVVIFSCEYWLYSQVPCSWFEFPMG